MGILDIENRTENWKSVEHFHGISEDAKLGLLKAITGSGEVQPNDIRIELFWYGMRDYIHGCDQNDKPTAQSVTDIYRTEFSDLREEVLGFRAEDAPHAFSPLRPQNYSGSEENQDDLFQNLVNTEIDIVIQSPRHLLIGEAKHESSLNADSSYVLVHQLIRQRVMAKVISELTGSQRQIDHFLIGDAKRLESLKNTVQVKFMINRGWLKEKNVMSWSRIEEIARGG